MAVSVAVTKPANVGVTLRTKVTSSDGRAPKVPSYSDLTTMAHAAGGTGATLTNLRTTTQDPEPSARWTDGSAASKAPPTWVVAGAAVAGGILIVSVALLRWRSRR